MTISEKTVHLHIGLPKTGTSYLQRLMVKHRAKLVAAGVWVTGHPVHAHRLAIESITDERRAAQADVRNIRATDLAAAEAELKRGLEDPHFRRLVVSSEYFFEADPAKVRTRFAALTDAPVRIIVFLRRQDRLIESGYNQEVKAMGHREAPRTPVYTPRLDWSLVLGAWADSFDAANVTAIGYDKAAAQNAVVERFFQALGIPAPKGFDDPDRTVNESLPADLLEFKRIANTFGEFGLQSWLYEAVAQGTWAGRFRFSREMATRFLELYAESNRATVERFLGGDRAELGLDEPVGEDPNGANFVEALPVETLAKVVAFHLKTQLEKERELRAHIERLEERLRQLEQT